MNKDLLAALAFSLFLTLVLELGLFWLTGKRDKKDLLLVCLVNILTNPAVVLLYWLVALYTKLNNVIVVIVLELCAIVVEGYYYRNYGQEFPHPYGFSLAANIVSFGIGLLIQMLFKLFAVYLVI